ncbi:mucin-2-like [Pseudoliparis swirei]|uniref:mucin-2-like n=1 Tax=Pseudoliparis swirei TaxID=2059687 RepID=UPI0024BD9EC2|nr:mucin-2-like [Pseudoliparis swirei]XP_056299329.1 mucin-2-like [Pseudoliparis swirei]
MEYHSGGSLPLLGRPRYCPGANANGGYLCETGHCCGETGCCTYYYELWWFWLLWTVLILFSCCCAYRHRRAKLRVQQQQRQREISLLAYHGANSYPSSMLDLSFLASLKLPSYEEVAAQPSTPPPPYSSVFTTPRYPQPPRTADPHLLTQHDPLLHRPLSDGPSSLSSDNSSSCSCDSCCPSSPCSSSLSAPVTYETDTSHATTPSEATPLAFDVTMETIAAAATRLEVNEARPAGAEVAVDIGDEDGAEAREPDAEDSLVTVAVVTGATSPQPLPSSGSEVPVGTTCPMKQQLDFTPRSPMVSAGSPMVSAGSPMVSAGSPMVSAGSPMVSAGSPVPLPSPTVDSLLPSIQTIESPAEDPKTTFMSGPSTLTESSPDTLTLRTLHLTRTFDTADVPGSPNSAPTPEVGRTLVLTDSASPSTPDPNPSLVPTPAPLNHTPAPAPVPSKLTQVLEPGPTNRISVSNPTLVNLTQPSTRVPNLRPKITIASDCETNPDLKPAPPDPTLASPTLAQCQFLELSPESDVALVPPSPMSGSAHYPESAAVLVSDLHPAAAPAGSGPSGVPSQSPDSDLLSPSAFNVQAGLGSGSGSASKLSSVGSRPGAPVLSFTTPASSSSSFPSITIESSFTPCQSPVAALSPSSPLPSSPSLPAPALLLDPLTALHQCNKGGSSPGHASSLSPSPRATQSPPKQTLFSPCVDVFEPGPPCWEDGEEEEEEDNDDDEDEDMGADESQYRHRRLTGDSGIEVCRCRVEEEEEEEEEEKEEEGARKEDGRRGGSAERDKNTGGDTDLHDSVDCPARGHTTTGEGLRPRNSASTATPTTEDGGKVVIVMETV